MQLTLQALATGWLPYLPIHPLQRIGEPMLHDTKVFSLLMLLTLAWLAQPSLTQAQSPSLKPGARIQLVAPQAFGTTGRVTARLERVTPDTLIIQRYNSAGQLEAKQPIPRASINGAYVWGGRDERTASLLGGAIGFGIGLAATSALVSASGGDEQFGQGGATLIGGLLYGGPAGALVGALIGSSMAPDRWVEVPLGTAHLLRAKPRWIRTSDGVGLALRVRFGQNAAPR